MNRCPKCGTRHIPNKMPVGGCLAKCRNDYTYLMLLGQAVDKRQRKMRGKARRLLKKMEQYVEELGG